LAQKGQRAILNLTPGPRGELGPQG
jgi:hypothetical protein